MISSYFDYISIVNSKVNNYNLCNLKDEFEIEKDIKVEIFLTMFLFFFCYA